MSLLIIIGIIWGICKLISAASAASKERVRQAEIERVRRAQERQRAEQARMREEWKAAQAAERERVRQMVALEKEQARQAKEQERLAKEREKQAAILAKHEKRIADIENKVRKLDRDIESQNETLADYYAQLDWLLLQQSGTTSGSKAFAAWQNKIVTKTNQIRNVENKIADMKDIRSAAKREIEAA